MLAHHPEDELRRLFAGIVEQVFFSELGVCTPAVADYLSNLLADFVHVDEIYRLQSVDGAQIREISRFHAEAAVGPEVDAVAHDRLVNRYIGDFALFWTGVYPETLRPRRQGGVDRLHEYVLQGKRGYGIAGELSVQGDHPPGDLLRELSDQFEFCVHGLHRVRETWRQLSGGPRQN